MILFLDTSSEKTSICLLGKNFEIIGEEVVATSSDLSDLLLDRINEMLKKNSFALKDISKIIVNQGPGSYTGLRIGLATANLLAFALNIPVFGIRSGNPVSDEGVAGLLKSNNSLSKTIKKFCNAVHPYYKFSPNITKKKPCL